MKHYENSQCIGIEEFYDDLNRIKYLKRLFKKYLVSGSLKERLILNHIIIFYNVFSMESATRLLFFKIEEEFHSILKTFLVYLKYLPLELRTPEVDIVSIPLHKEVMNILREI
jgi:hypothetical protein